MRLWLIASTLASLVAASGSCSSKSCDRAACNTAAAPAHFLSVSSGVAGFVASQTDACGDGCCECSTASDTLTIWRTPAVVMTADAGLTAMRDAERIDRMDVMGRYERALDPGNYLVCDLELCVGFAVPATGVVTVNLERGWGSQMIAFAPDGSSLASSVFPAGGFAASP